MTWIFGWGSGEVMTCRNFGLETSIVAHTKDSFQIIIRPDFSILCFLGRAPGHGECKSRHDETAFLVVLIPAVKCNAHT